MNFLSKKDLIIALSIASCILLILTCIYSMETVVTIFLLIVCVGLLALIIAELIYAYKNLFRKNKE